MARSCRVCMQSKDTTVHHCKWNYKETVGQRTREEFQGWLKNGILYVITK